MKGLGKIISPKIFHQTRSAPSSSFLHLLSSANASPIFEGRGGDDLALELSKALERTFCTGAVDLSSLCVISGKCCWILYVDAVVRLSFARRLSYLSIYLVNYLFVYLFLSLFIFMVGRLSTIIDFALYLFKAWCDKYYFGE